MATSYVYTLSGDFTNASQIESSLLQQIITTDVTVNVDPDYINVDGDNVTVGFPSSLTAGQKTGLDNIISAYIYVAIPNATTSPAYQTLVSNDAHYPGDYTSIAAAFTDGAISVFVKNGVYVETSNIIIPNGGQLNGELPGKTIVVLAGAVSIKIDGSGGVKENTGTISVTHNTTTVTGVGTTFTNLSAGNFILLGTNYYDILTIDSDTQITLLDTYQGRTISSATYTAQAMDTGSVISNLIVTGSTSVGVYIRALRHGNLRSVAITKCTKCVEIVDSGDLSINEVIPTFSGGIGFYATNCVSLSLHTVNVFNCVSHGFDLDGKNLVAESCASENNKGNGISLGSNAIFTNINDCVIKHNNGIGIKMETSAMCNTVSNTEISNNNGIGLDIQSANNNVTACFIINNNGIGVICGIENIIEGNTIIDNSGDGIKLPSGSDSCTICDNSLKNNTGIGVNILSEKSGVNDNHIKTSGGDGIFASGIKNKISGNTVIGGSGKGIHISSGGDNCIITGNIVDTNIGNGFLSATGVINSIVTSNNFGGNTGTNYVNSGTGTVAANNIS